MTWSARVSVDGWAATTGPVPEVDEFGCVWVLTDLVGWFDGAAPRSVRQPRMFRDGVLRQAPLFEGRTVTMSGTVIAPDEAALLGALDRILDVLSGDVRIRTLVIDEVVRGVSRQAEVELASGTLTARVGKVAATFSLSVFAADPLRYSTELYSGSTARFQPGEGRTYDLTFPRAYGASGSTGFVNVSNSSSRAVWPVIRLEGPLVNPVVQLVGGPWVGLAMNIVAGEVVVIDMGAATVRIGDASRNGFLMLGSRWFALPKGASQVYLAADSGTGAMTVEWRAGT